MIARGPTILSTVGTACPVSAAIVLLLAGCLTHCCGCGKRELPTTVIWGMVTFDGQKVEQGTLRFVPIEGTLGPVSTAAIRNGEYRIDARGGVPIGTHRIEVDARMKTGRKVKGSKGLDQTLIDETVRVGPEAYIDQRSPLHRKVIAQSDGQIDIEIPKH